jgi:transposase
MRTSGTAAELEVRRKIAVGLLRQGMSVADAALGVEASVSSIRRWQKAVQSGGIQALAAKPHLGPTPKLSDLQKAELVEILLCGPLAAGYATDLWTCGRVQQVIHRRFGVTYHVDHVGRLLHSLGFSPQQPRRRARERDEQAIERWRRQAWPRIKKGESGGKLASCFSMKAASCCSP